jgi:hypothetical protein
MTHTQRATLHVHFRGHLIALRLVCTSCTIHTQNNKAVRQHIQTMMRLHNARATPFRQWLQMHAPTFLHTQNIQTQSDYTVNAQHIQTLSRSTK